MPIEEGNYITMNKRLILVILLNILIWSLVIFKLQLFGQQLEDNYDSRHSTLQFARLIHDVRQNDETYLKNWWT